MTQPETHAFQADVERLLDVVIHSLYSHKEIFLRELLSNAADALDKLRFRAITEPALFGEDRRLEIHILPDRERGTLTIEDTGIGMTRDELVENLGSVAHSGSRSFVEQMKQKGDGAASLIGQFGVGFYSAFLVSDRVDVVSRAAGESVAHRWSSDAKSTYTIEPAEKAERGTSVVLHLKKEQSEFLDAWRLRELVTRHSDFVDHPIKLQVEKKDAAPELQTINSASALWRRPKSDITDAQYEEFYKHLTHAVEAPLARTHFRVEGSQEFVALLFVPKTKPWNFDAAREHRGVRLFVKRVFIMDDCEELLPRWLRFLRGVVDSDDLPLNVSRESLQDSSAVRTIQKQLTKRALDLLDETARERPADYDTFVRAFGVALKEGLALDSEHKDRLAELVRYASSRGTELTSLADYVARMPEGQDAIYYIYGESHAAVAGSPHLEALKTRGYEVLYLTDPVDEWAADSLREFHGKKLVSAMRADLKLEATEEQKKERETKVVELKPLLDHMQKVLAESVREVTVSDRLTDSPCCLVVPEGASHAFMERLMRESGRTGPTAKRILEVNPTHPLVAHLRALEGRETTHEKLDEWIRLLYEQALLAEGSALADPHRFAKSVTALLEYAAGAVS